MNILEGIPGTTCCDFEMRLEPLQNLIQIMLIQAINEACGHFVDVPDDKKDEVQKNAISFIYSDVFDDYCEYIGWNAEQKRDQVNKYICENYPAG